MSEQSLQSQQFVTLTIDGQIVTVPKGTTVYQAARRMGIEIPIFCYHDRMPPFGACRVCLVEVEKMGKLQTSCTLEATEGMVVNTAAASAEQGRREIIEYLLINHPLDCPICDRGGECPLQDNAIKYGPGMSRFFEEKRQFEKPKPLGPVLMLDRERCIICARCTRFGELIAGDHALQFQERGYQTEVGTPGGGAVESKFIGNTIMICPVGALTSKVYRFRARPWDNDSTESTCTLCPLGCSMVIDSRDGEIMRTRSKENRAVNDQWLCDKGWFGYEFSHHPERLKTPLIRRNGQLEPASWMEALELIASKMNEAKSGGKLAGWGGNPLTLEENYLFQKLMREGAGSNHLDHRIGMPLFSREEEELGPGMEMEIGDIEDLTYAVLFGLDLTEEFPVIWLRLKQAINKGAPVFFCGHYAPEISPHLTQTILHAPGEEIEQIGAQFSQIAALAAKGGRGAIFVGSQYLHSPHRKAILAHLIKQKEGLDNITLNVMEGRGNSQGARLAGMRPDCGFLDKDVLHCGKNAEEVLEEGSATGWDFLYTAGADPASVYPSNLWSQFRSKLRFLVVQDLFLTQTAKEADVVLPTLSFVEKGGSFVNIEGRILTIAPGKAIPSSLLSDSNIFIEVGKMLNVDLSFESEFLDLLGQEKAPRWKKSANHLPADAAIESDEATLRATFSRQLFDHGVRMQHNTHLVQMANQPSVRIHPEDADTLGLRDGERASLTCRTRAIEVKIKRDDKVAKKTAVMPLGFNLSCPVRELGVNLLNSLPIQLTPVSPVES